jgi:hypothetical protein
MLPGQQTSAYLSDWLILLFAYDLDLFCLDDAAQALQAFHRSLVDTNGNLNDWTGNDPCAGWTGVYCQTLSSNISYVTELWVPLPLPIGLGHLTVWHSGCGGCGTGVTRECCSAHLLVDSKCSDSHGGDLDVVLTDVQWLLCRRLFQLNLGGTLVPELGNLSQLIYL